MIPRLVPEILPCDGFCDRLAGGIGYPSGLIRTSAFFFFKNVFIMPTFRLVMIYKYRRVLAAASSSLVAETQPMITGIQMERD